MKRRTLLAFLATLLAGGARPNERWRSPGSSQ